MAGTAMPVEQISNSALGDVACQVAVLGEHVEAIAVDGGRAARSTALVVPLGWSQTTFAQTTLPSARLRAMTPLLRPMAPWRYTQSPATAIEP